MLDSKLKPLSDRVVVKVIKSEEEVVSGIIIAGSDKDKHSWGEIIAVGDGKTLDNGSRAPMGVKLGDNIIFTKYGGTEVKIDGETYLILRENEILAVKDADA